VSKKGDCSKSDNIIIVALPDFMEITTYGEIAVFNDNQNLYSVSPVEQTLRWKRRASGDVTSLAMTPVGTRILVGTDNGNIDLFDNKGNILWNYSVSPSNKPGAVVKSVALSNDGNIVVAGTDNGNIVGLNAAGRELWSNQTNDHINHIAISADGSLVVATGDETVYAFLSSAQSKTPVRSPSPTKNSTVFQSDTTIPKTITSEIPDAGSTTREPTSVPTTYSIIRTRQSPVPALIPLMGILVAWIVLVRKR
jgi:outer membrane protein assembly factor BamB